jgi:hypothetical protein
MGLRAGLHAVEKRRIACLCRESNPGYPALYWLSRLLKWWWEKWKSISVVAMIVRIHSITPKKTPVLDGLDVSLKCVYKQQKLRGL